MLKMKMKMMMNPPPSLIRFPPLTNINRNSISLMVKTHLTPLSLRSNSSSQQQKWSVKMSNGDENSHTPLENSNNSETQNPEAPAPPTAIVMRFVGTNLWDLYIEVLTKDLGEVFPNLSFLVIPLKLLKKNKCLTLLRCLPVPNSITLSWLCRKYSWEP